MPPTGTVRQGRSLSLARKLKANNGFTFIEIMVTLVILSVGIVGVYQALFASLDHMSRLKGRLYADILLEEQIAVIERQLRAYKTLPMENPVQEIDVGVAKISFEPQLVIGEVDQFTDVFKIDLEYVWIDRNRQNRLGRSAYLSDFLLDEHIQ